MKRCIPWILGACFILPLFASGQSPQCACEKLPQVLQRLESDLGRTLGPVRLQRVEEIEDKLFVPKVINGELRSPYFVYQVETRSRYMEGGKIVEASRTGKLPLYIATSRNGVEVYKLGGFPDSENQFAALLKKQSTKESKISVNAAVDRALLCSELLYEMSPDSLVFDVETAKVDLARHFVHTRKPSPLQSADSWWNDYLKTHPDFKSGPSIHQKGADYSVALPYLWATVEGDPEPEIRFLEVVVRQDGACHKAAE